jgi:DNA-binding NtrC family response regulator
MKNPFVPGFRPNKPRVLAIGVSAQDQGRLSEIAQSASWELVLRPTLEEGVTLLRTNEHFIVVVLDRDLPGVVWRQAISTLAALVPGARVMLASSVNDDMLWQGVIEEGGYDVLSKPFRSDQVLRSILHAHWYATLKHS